MAFHSIITSSLSPKTTTQLLQYSLNRIRNQPIHTIQRTFSNHIYKYTNTTPLISQNFYQPIQVLPNPQGNIRIRTYTNNKKTKPNGALINEHLIRSLMKRNKKDSAKDIRIRLLIDQGRESPPDVQVLSLSKAITISGERSVDLVAINLKQDVPIVKAIDYQKFMYDQKKKSSGSNKNSNNTKKAVKEYSFRAGIQDNDLQRKAENMISYLEKGHNCQVVITVRRRYMTEDGMAVPSTLERIQNFVQEYGEPTGKMKQNGYGNRASLMFQPRSKQ